MKTPVTGIASSNSSVVTCVTSTLEKAAKGKATAPAAEGTAWLSEVTASASVRVSVPPSVAT